jgi:hypothetical protein
MRVQPVQSAPMRFAQERSAPVRVEPNRSAPVRNEPVRIAPFQNLSRVVGPGPQLVSPERRVVSPQPGRAYYGQRYSDGRTVGNPVIVGHAGPRPMFPDNSGRRFFGEPRRFIPRSEFEGRFEGRPVFAEPFFRFRPRFRFGFGLFVGYPVAFPYGYYYNPYDYAYGYPVYGMAEPVPTYQDNGYYGSPNGGYADNSANFGGVTFDIQPTNAAIYIDGKYIGTVAEFSPQQPPLSLTLGRHRVDLRLQGFETMSFDMDVVAGQVIPYQGAMTVIR